MAARADTVTYVGHATTLIDVGGVRLLTDPVLRDRVAHLRRIAPPAPRAEQLAADAVLISHAHHDHLDLPSLRRIGRGVRVLAPRACAAMVSRRTGHDVTAVAEGDRIVLGAVELVVVRAVHDGRRFGAGGAGAAVGYLVLGTSTVYFAGDTDLFDGMRALADRIDVALLPVWGWGARVGDGHMSPERAASAAALLAPRLAVPIHWGTLSSPRVWWRADAEMPARRFAAAVAEVAPAVRVEILAPGAQLAIPASA
jgi:L-ascorbate metabolism protein UlaG (beta-lactamase superfamily)